MPPTLLILAAGMASRYGSMKQTEGFGPTGETIMDYSIFDAIRSGFKKVVFVIRKDFAENFEAQFNEKLGGLIEVEYVYQELSSFVDKEDIVQDRTKPWGTGHAILCAKESIQEPFAVINADDFYGKDAYSKAAKFLLDECNPLSAAIIGYQLDKTLSDHGTVSRGVCNVDDQQNLVTINERTKIYAEDGRVYYDENDEKIEVDKSSSVSMNFWCFHPTVFSMTAQLFKDFLQDNKDNIKAEFFIPILAENFIQKSKGRIKVIPTSAQWFGVTYKEDAPSVKASLNSLIAKQEYPESLWNLEKIA